MPNRAERRAQSKRGRQGVQPSNADTRGRGRSGLSDEYALQERSRRLVEHQSAQWQPSSSVEDVDAATSVADRRPARAGFRVRQWLKLVSWVLIAVSAVAFLVIMWLPGHPMWLIITVSAVFVVGVLSLFLSAEDPRHNPNLDANGTAV